MCIKFHGLIFHAFDWQENLWVLIFVAMAEWQVQLLSSMLGINFRGV